MRKRSKKLEVVIEEEDKKRTPNYTKRTRIALWFLVIAGVLGLISSVATVTNSFTIKDLEEQSPNDLATFSVWVLDSETGRSLDGVSISLSSGSYYVNSTTDSEGLAVMNNVRTGVLEIEISHPGYKTVRGEAVISKGSPNVLDIPMEKGPTSDEVSLPLTQLRTPKYTSGLTSITAVIMFLASLMAFVSAFFLRAKEFFSLSVITAFLPIFSFGFIIGSLFSLAAVVLIINSYGGFSHNYDLKMILEQQGREDLKNFFRGERRAPLGLPPVNDAESWD